MKRYRNTISPNISSDCTTTNFKPRNARATPALHHPPTETSTLHFKYLNTIQDYTDALHPISGLGISYTTDTTSVKGDSRGRRDPCQQLVNPMQVGGKGVLGFSPVLPSTQGMDAPPVDLPSTMAFTFSSPLPSIMNYAANHPLTSAMPCSSRFKFDAPIDLFDDVRHISAIPIGLVADVNMHDFYLSVVPPLATVNPVDTLRSSPYPEWLNQTPLLPTKTAADQITESPTFDFPSSTTFDVLRNSITRSASEVVRPIIGIPPTLQEFPSSTTLNVLEHSITRSTSKEGKPIIRSPPTPQKFLSSTAPNGLEHSITPSTSEEDKPIIPTQREFPSSTTFNLLKHSITPSASEEDKLINCSPSTPQEPIRESQQPSPKSDVGYLHHDHTYIFPEPPALGNHDDHARVSSPDEMHFSPVLNAHHGVELRELKRRAEQYRLNNPGQDLTRSWLAHFAGQLSQRGELLDDYRCYVVGCEQRNKRKDHILVHVGAHVDQRPFACSVCSDRFLRKNECKRHEASHGGYRPYSCDVCGRRFSRKDLVKKHLKRVHWIWDDMFSEMRMEKRVKLDID